MAYTEEEIAAHRHIIRETWRAAYAGTLISWDEHQRISADGP